MTFISPEDFLDKLNQWFNGFIALPLLAVAYGYLEIFSGGLAALVVVADVFTYLVIGLGLAYSIMATRFYKTQIKNINGIETITLRLASYFAISKSFFLKIFVVSLFSVLGLYITGDVAFAGFYAFLLFLLSIYRPGLLNVANKLGLKGEERREFLKKSNFKLN